jgi:TRAP-type transport system small permease protein
MYQRMEFGLAALLFVAIVLLVGIASITRFLGSPIIWSIEIAQLFFVWICMLAADLALQQDRHFGLSIVLDSLSPRGRRIAEIVNTVILLILLGFLLVYAVRNTVLMHPRLIGATQMNASLVHAAMPFGLVLMLRTLLVRLYRSLRPRSAL